MYARHPANFLFLFRRFDASISKALRQGTKCKVVYQLEEEEDEGQEEQEYDTDPSKWSREVIPRALRPTLGRKKNSYIPSDISDYVIYQAKILTVQENNPRWPGSPWECLHVSFGADSSKLSPWELDPHSLEVDELEEQSLQQAQTSRRRSGRRGEQARRSRQIQATQAASQEGANLPNEPMSPSDYLMVTKPDRQPGLPEEGSHRFLEALVNLVETHPSAADPFLAPVPGDVDGYYDQIPRPIDLSLIRLRVLNHWYRKWDALRHGTYSWKGVSV